MCSPFKGGSLILCNTLVRIINLHRLKITKVISSGNKLTSNKAANTFITLCILILAIIRYPKVKKATSESRDFNVEKQSMAATCNNKKLDEERGKMKRALGFEKTKKWRRIQREFSKIDGNT